MALSGPQIWVLPFWKKKKKLHWIYILKDDDPRETNSIAPPRNTVINMETSGLTPGGGNETQCAFRNDPKYYN